MEEDIKILEKLMEDGKEDFTDTRLSDYEIKAIENLMARNRELEEINKEHQKLNEELQKRIMELENDNHIPHID